MARPEDTSFAERHYRVLLGLLACFYFGLELFYVLRLPLVMDEFQGAHHVHLLKSKIPYLDFRPYKTVLGYYIQLPSLLLGGGVWTQLMTMKLYLVLVNTGAVLLSSQLLRKRFRPGAVLLALFAMVCVSTFLERSAELRVDMLTAWAGLLSFLLLLDRKMWQAGLLAGLSFLISQKGGMYGLAGGLALVALWAVHERNKPGLRNLMVFCAWVVLPIVVYLALWVAVASFDSVIGSGTTTHKSIATTDMYRNMHKYWIQTLVRNPTFYGVAALSLLVALFRAFRLRCSLSLIVTVYAGAIVAISIWYPQPWPYFFVLLIPTLAVAICHGLDLSWSRLPSWALVIFFALVCLLPLRRVAAVAKRDSAYQRHTVTVAESLLNEGDTYLGGIEFLFDRTQAPHELRWLDRARLLSLRRHGQGERAIEMLKAAPPKFLIWNYRLRKLPGVTKKWVDANYTRLRAAIRIYAPTVRGPFFSIAHTGTYELISRREAVIDGKTVVPAGTIHLEAGVHVAPLARYRLKLRTSADTWESGQKLELERRMFRAVYYY